MKLQILIPHYKEDAEVIKPLLDSIAIQQSIDFNEVGVIICHDGKRKYNGFEEGIMGFEIAETPIDADCSSFHTYYPFKIEQVWQEHSGVSAARNTALDHATADYVMFCDADDMFCHACGFYILFNEMNIGFDTLTSVFIEETRHPQTKDIIYINHDMDSTFVHGKCHRRKYLIENDIRFNPDLTIHEDSYFNILAKELAPTDRAKYCPTPFYLWKWRDESVCRHDKDYILKTYNNMIDSNDALVDQFIKRGIHDKASFYTGFMLLDAYYTMNKKEWTDKTHKDYRDAVERRFSEYYAKHKDIWNKLSEQEKAVISNGVRSRFVNEGMPMETITIDAWLKHISGITQS